MKLFDRGNKILKEAMNQLLANKEVDSLEDKISLAAAMLSKLIDSLKDVIFFSYCYQFIFH